MYATGLVFNVPGPSDTARLIGLDLEAEREREEVALAKLRHPSTPGVLTHLRSL